MGYRPPESAILREYERSKRQPLLSRIFRERNVYLRTDGGVRHLRITTRMQVAAVGVVAALGLWTVYATVNTAFKDRMLALKDSRLASERQAHEESIARQKAVFDAERRKLQKIIDELDSRLLANQDEWLEKVEALRRDYERLLERQRVLDQYLDRTGLLPSSRKRSGVERHGALPAARGFAASETSGGGHAGIGSEVVIRNARQADALLDGLRKLRERAIRNQLALLDGARKKAGRRLAAIRAVLGRLKLDPRRVARLARPVPDAQGGPFIPVSARQNLPPPFAKRLNGIAELLSETARLVAGMERLPIRKPMTSYRRISSRFGYRTDPIRRRLALHEGIDFKAPYGAPVLATAPGTVIRAGWTGSYGKLVEIRHANGLVTRYAHLSRIGVRTGQKVRAGQKIGRLGNTGRSTGPHLHYEVRLSGKPLDPARFWKAGHDIRKIEADG